MSQRRRGTKITEISREWLCFIWEFQLQITIQGQEWNCTFAIAGFALKSWSRFVLGCVVGAGNSPGICIWCGMMAAWLGYLIKHHGGIKIISLQLCRTKNQDFSRCCARFGEKLWHNSIIPREFLPSRDGILEDSQALHRMGSRVRLDAKKFRIFCTQFSLGTALWGSCWWVLHGIKIP